MFKLLTRDDFRNKVLARDNHKCVVPGCNKEAVDAHHIVERKLWHNGGYYLENGASVCETHHKLAEINKILPITLREYIGIKNKILPLQLDKNKEYTKWGKELISKQVYNMKYPTTYYFSFSKRPDNHKKDIGNVDNLTNCPVVLTIKMDGSNVKINTNFVAARNGMHADHKSFDYLKVLHSKLKDNLPVHLDIFGEWLYAKHSIHYIDDLALENYLQIFGIYNLKTQMWSSWDDVEKMAKQLGVTTVPVIKTDIYSNKYLLSGDVLHTGIKLILDGHEGIVMRNIFPFHNSKFQNNVMKYVRANHIQTDKHWSNNQIIKNELQ